MKTLKLMSLTLLLVAAFGCDKDDSNDPVNTIKIDDIVGSWIATSAIHTNNANTSETLDIVAYGGEIRTTILDQGGARTWVEFGTFQDEWDAQLTIDGDILTSTPQESSRPVQTLKIEFDGDTLVTTNTNDSFDFTLSSMTPVSSTSEIRWIRH